MSHPQVSPGGGVGETQSGHPLPVRALLGGALVAASRPRGHSHTILTIHLTLCLVLHLHLSWRSVTGVFALFAAWAPCQVPAFTTARHWLLWLGLFVLRRPLQAAVGGWLLLVDHTIQLGQRKALVVLGLPLAALRRTGFTLALRQVVVLAVEVLTHSTAERVYEVLQTVQARVGSIAQIVSDHGADVLQGIRRLQQDRPGLVATYDVRHALACLLKAELEPDASWQALLRQGSATLMRLRQTSGHFLAPPPLRHKARYMNVAGHIRWAQQLLQWEAAADWSALARQLGQTAAEAQQWWAERLGWLQDWRAPIAEYVALLEVVESAEAAVLQEGLSRPSAARWWLQCQANRSLWNWRVAAFAERVRRWLQAEGEAVPEGQTRLGSSDVIESLLGKDKALVERSPSQEFTAHVLLLPLLTAELSPEEIREGLETVGGPRCRSGCRTKWARARRHGNERSWPARPRSRRPCPKAQK